MTSLTRRRKLLVVIGLLAAAVPVLAASRRFGTSDQIAVGRSDAAPVVQPVVLFHGWRNGVCRAFERLTAFDAVGDASQPGTPDCPAWDVAFARGSAPTVKTSPDWVVSGSGKTLTFTLTPPVTVPVSMWVITDVSGTPPWPVTNAQQALAEANAVFEAGSVGIVLELSDVIHLVRRNEPLAATIGSGCGHVNDIRGDASAYSKDQFNVYFVSSLKEPRTSDGIQRVDHAVLELGRNCVAYGAPEITFIDYDDGIPGTLAHELGHGLGLLEPDSGHVDGVTGLSHRDNVMRDGWNAEGGEVSLGQAFRMYFDTRSWLNRTLSFTDHPFLVTCQTSVKSDWPCPHLALDIPRGNP